MDNYIIKVNKSNYGFSYILKCFNCNKEFKVGKMSYDKGRYKKYCSMKCKVEERNEIIECLICKKEFKAIKSSKAKYCSIKCVGILHKRKKTIEHRQKIANSHIGIRPNKDTKLKQSKIRTDFYEKYPERHPNIIMSKKGFISKPQKEMFGIIKGVYPDSELEYPIKTDFGLKFADVAIPSLRIVCEYDGSYWHNGNEKNDLIRQKAIENKNWTVLRFNEKSYKDCLSLIR